MLNQKLNWFCLLATWDDTSVSGTIVTRCSYIYFLLKLLDLFDTVNLCGVEWKCCLKLRFLFCTFYQVFFVLRKKTDQVTFLHTYHHAGMLAMTYFHIKFMSGGGHGVFLGLVNSYVHLVMYGYYLLTSMKINVASSWKKFITQIQMVRRLKLKALFKFFKLFSLSDSIFCFDYAQCYSIIHWL